MPKNAMGFFKGASEVPIYSSDVVYPEYQESHFYYIFGVSEMDCYGVIDFEKEKSILFIPRPDEMYKIWMTVLGIEDFRKKYPLIDEIQYAENLENFFTERKPEKVYVNSGINSDSGLQTMVAESKFYDAVCKETDT
jgi:Xaa-Pro aminopeptidase